MRGRCTSEAERLARGRLRWRPWWALALLAGATLAACDPPSEELFAPDASRTGLGNEGAFGARWIQGSLRVRADQTLPVDLFLPTGGEELAAGPFPAVVLLQGGLVDVQRYAWLGGHMATRGFVVLAPHHAGQLAFFEQGNALDALTAARQASRAGAGPLSGRVDEGPAMVIGHSLGGVVAAKAWLAASPEEISHLTFLASLPGPADDVGAREEGRVLSLTGTADTRLPPDEAAAGLDGFEVPTVGAAVEGMSHYQLTDMPSERELTSDGEPGVPEAVARRRALYLVDAALAELAGRGEGEVLDEPSSWPAGLVPFAELDDEEGEP